MALVAVGLAAGLAVLAGALALVQQRSQAVLDARYPLPPSPVRAATSPEAVARGAHLVVVAACTGCHGDDLTGRVQFVSGSPIVAPNLTILARRLSVADLDRAIRRGLLPDGTSELAMPSQAYAGFTDDEIAAIAGDLRSLEPRGTAAPRSRPGLMLRLNLLAGVVRPTARKLAEAVAPTDAGPRFEPGRRLARVACGQCHGTDLAGSGGAPGPDLTLRGAYDRAQFHALMRTGAASDDGDIALMARTARRSFSHFTDAEIDAIFDYLTARDRIRGAGDRRQEAR